jgi:DNA-binding NtrC family response regulator
MAHAVDPAEVLVTNLWMPRLGGQGLIRAMRTSNPGLPIICTTGDSHNAPVGEHRLIVIMKPYPLRQVAEAVERLLGRGR